MRALLIAACLAAVCPTPPAAQQAKWSGALGIGYANGAGDAFNGRGALWVTAAGYRGLSRVVRGGLELGHDRFSSIVSLISDVYGPGSLIREDFRRTYWQASAAMRIRPERGMWRPYAGTGVGAYLVHVHDQIVTRDANGAELPGLQFEQSSTEVKPGIHLLAGLERVALLGRGGLAVQARWDGILAGSLGNVVSVGVVLTLD